MDHLKHLIENTLIPHSAFSAATKQLEQCFTYAKNALEPICLPIVGESRTGKSRTLEYILQKHLRVRSDEGVHIPVIAVRTPAKPTVKGLAEQLLLALGDPKFDKGTEQVKTARLQTIISQCGTRMIIVDEFQHFIDKGSSKIAYHVTDWLKTLVEESRVAIVVAGLPTCLDVIVRNEQLDGRFMAPIVMPRFTWEKLDDREEFIAILAEFHASMSPHFDLPNFSNDEMAFRFHCASGGLIGYVAKMLRIAVWQAIDENNKTIQLAELAKAQAMAVNLGKLENPFNPSFSAIPTPAKLGLFASIGAHIEQAVSGRSKLKVNKPDWASDLLLEREA